MPIDNPRRPRSALKTYFVKNAIPTEAQFAELIDAGINQRDDGVFKTGGEPLSVEAAGEATGTRRAIAFWSSFTDQNPAWTIALNARRAAAEPASARTGWSVLDASGAARLTIDANTGNVGVGTITPGERLEVDGRVRAGALTIGAWAPDGAYAAVSNAATDQNSRETYALLQRNDGVTFLNSTGTLSLRIRNKDRVVVEDAVVGVQGGLRVDGTLLPSAGADARAGIAFPDNPGKGGGDGAWLRYYARSGETTTLDIGTSNDEDDHIALMPGMRNGGSLANVGIGTYDPKDKLHVAGRVRAGPIVSGEWVPDPNFGFVGAAALDQGKAPNYALRQSGEGGFKGLTCLNSPTAVSLRVADVERVLVEGGAMTVTPPLAAKAGLSVSGALTVAAGKDGASGIGFTPNPGAGGGDEAWLRYYARAGEDTTLEIGTGNDPEDHISLMPGMRDGKPLANVGIGTLTPANRLDVAGDIALNGQHALRGNDGWLRLNQDGKFKDGTHTPGLFAPNALNVGFAWNGWSNPGAGNIAYSGWLNKLDVREEFSAFIRCADFYIGGYPGRKAKPGRALVDLGTSLSINHGPDWARTEIGGQVWFNNQVQTSSGKLKEGIAPISGPEAAAIVDGLDPVRFRWKDKAETQLGFIAEECPAAVTTEGKDGIYVAHIVAALTRVVRDQTATIAALTDRLGRLEARA